MSDSQRKAFKPRNSEISKALITTPKAHQHGAAHPQSSVSSELCAGSSEFREVQKENNSAC